MRGSATLLQSNRFIPPLSAPGEDDLLTALVPTAYSPSIAPMCGFHTICIFLGGPGAPWEVPGGSPKDLKTLKNDVWSLLACFFGAPKLTWEPQKPCKTLGFLQFYYKTMGSCFSFGAGGGRFVNSACSGCVFALCGPHVRIAYYLHILGRSRGSLGAPQRLPEGPQNLKK